MHPKLKYLTFGRNNNDDKFAFENFFSQFENCVSGIESEAAKLHCFRGGPADCALQIIIQHLTINEENYDAAI